MRYELIKATPEAEVFLEKDKEQYSCNIQLEIKDITSNYTTPFNVFIEIISHNKQTGYEVDKQRSEAINEYLKSIEE